MYHLSTLLATAILASTAICASTPEKRTRDIVAEIYGPIEKWIPIRLIDVYPDARVDGLPVNDSVIYSYEPPASATQEQHDALAAALSPNGTDSSLTKRSSLDCYYSGTFVTQYQLGSAKNTICNEASDKGISNGGSYGSYREWFDAGNNNWQHITNSYGWNANVWFWIQVNGGYNFNWDVCYNGFWEVINDCKGDGPDTAGGTYWGYNNEQMHVQIDPVE